MAGNITRRGRIVRIAVALVVCAVNGASFGQWAEPFLGWTLSGVLWMSISMSLMLYMVYHFVQLIRQSKASE